MDKSPLLELSVIIVNYNVKYFLEQCLYSVQKACSNLEAEIFVADNNSTDRSKEYLEKKFPQVNFIWNSFNSGFANANNAVLPETKGKYILFLNPDTIVSEDCFEKCIQHFHSQPDCGALGVKMIDGSGRYLRESKRSFPTASASLFKLCGLSSIFPSSKLFSKYYAGYLPENSVNKVEVLAGAFIMASRNALEKVKGFDSNFFMYGEDIDLCFRIKQEGFGIYYFPETTIIHFKGESTQKKRMQYNEHFYGAMKLYVKKHFSENKSGRFLLLNAINLSGFFASLKSFFIRISTPIINLLPFNKKSANTLVIGNHKRFNDILPIIKNSVIALTIADRTELSNEKIDTNEIALENIIAIIRKKRIGKMILCENELSYKSIIQVMEILKGKVDFFIHSNNSDSIIGSNDKNTNGVFMIKSQATQV